jgi:RNA polymerase sigma-70 factor, ECF subfamily
MVDDSPYWTNDVLLVQQVNAGDKEACEAFYTRFRLLVSSTAWRFTKPNEAEAKDLGQEIWLTLLISLPKWKDSGALSGWVAKVAINCSLSWLRRKRPTLSTDELRETSWDAPSASADPHQELEQKRLRQAIDQCMQKLENNDHQAALRLFLMSYSYDEIARILDKPVTSITNWLYRARRSLLKCLQKRLGNFSARNSAER